MVSHLVWVLCLISFSIFSANFVNSEENEDANSDRVVITSSSNIKFIKVPTSDNPILTWMEIRKGVFPNVTNSLTPETSVRVGEPITLFIFYKDDSNLYDIRVSDCWAYDDGNFPLSKQKLHLNEDSSVSNKIAFSKWKKFRSKKYPSFLYATFISFKFPDREKIFLTCDVQLIGKKQSKNEEETTFTTS